MSVVSTPKSVAWLPLWRELPDGKLQELENVVPND